MCCHRRRNRAPALVVLGKLAYDKYQERQAKKVQSSDSQRKINPELLENKVDGEILERVGIPPPSYNDVVVNQAKNPDPGFNVSEKAFRGDKNFIKEYTNHEDTNEVPNGLHSPIAYQAPLQSSRNAYRGDCCGRQNGSYPSKCEQRRAEKMARKAEKETAKLQRAQGHV